MRTASLEATEAFSAERSTAPRVSLDDMKAKIFNTHFLLASTAIAAAEPNTTFHHNSSLDLLTICILEMQNGFTVIGKSAPASRENFDEEKGRTFAYEDAIRQLWPLEGYLLRERLFHGEFDALAPYAPGPSTTDGTEKTLFRIPSSDPDALAYVGTKGVFAKPMTRLEYNQLRGWDVPSDEDPNDAGYLVEYADGQRANVEGYEGYVSWSPADVFEGAYHRAESVPQ